MPAVTELYSIVPGKIQPGDKPSERLSARESKRAGMAHAVPGRTGGRGEGGR